MSLLSISSGVAFVSADCNFVSDSLLLLPDILLNDCLRRGRLRLIPTITELQNDWLRLFDGFQNDWLRSFDGFHAAKRDHPRCEEDRSRAGDSEAYQPIVLARAGCFAGVEDNLSDWTVVD